MNRSMLSAACALAVFVVHLAAQGAQTPPPAGGQTQTPGQQGPPGPGGRGRGRGAVFPAQQRPPADPAVVERGKAVYDVNCRACHGPDLRGGDMGGPNLLRSQVVLNDQHGELILPVVRNGRMNPGMPAMPPLPLSDEDVKAVAEYIHSVAATMRGQGAPPPGEEVPLNILVGDAAAGQAYFAARCASCHSAAADLKGIATKVADPLQLQNYWITGGGGGRGRGAGPGSPITRQVMVTVTPSSGAPVSGRLDRIDDFVVTLTTAEGLQRSFTRRGDQPKVDIRDPLEGHRKLLTVYTDKDIHDVTAYLVTLK